MALVNDTDTRETSTGPLIFQDGDMLVMTLPAVVDLSLFTSLNKSIEDTGNDTVQQILLDCSPVEKLCASGIAAFLSLDRLSRERRIRLLILDPPVGISRQLDPLLPAATWIDSQQEAYERMASGTSLVA